MPRRVRRASTYGLLLLLSSGALGASLLLALALLEQGLRDQDLLVGRDGTAGQSQISTGPAYRGMEQSAGARSVAVARHSLLWLTRDGFDR